MANKNKIDNNITDSNDFDDIQQLSQRFIELWQQQLSIISDSMIIDDEIAKKASEGHDNTGNKTRTNATHGAAPAGAASLDIVNILQQLSNDIKRIDRRISGIEQQIFPPKPTKKSSSTGAKSAKKPKKQ